jgi:hypothetical protein
MTGVMYKNMVLTIPDAVLPTDIPQIINWFLYYNIAEVKDVNIYKHPEPEYYVEDSSRYGYAVIKIAEWYNNNGSRNFYDNIVYGRAKMVYNDPHFWEVEFYEPRTQEEVQLLQVDMVVNSVERKFFMTPLMLPIMRQNASILPPDDTIGGDGSDLNYVRTETVYEDYNSDYDDEEFINNKPGDMETQYNNLIEKNNRILSTEFVTLDDLRVKKNKSPSKNNKPEPPPRNVWMRRLRLKQDY